MAASLTVAAKRTTLIRFRATDADLRRLKRLARQSGRTASDVLRRLIAEEHARLAEPDSDK